MDLFLREKMKMITKRIRYLPLLQCILLGAIHGCIFNEQSKIPDYTAYCCGPNNGNKTFVTPTQICCNGTVHDRRGRKCCNGELYDPTQRICCDDKLHEKGDRGCCGSKLYRDTTDQVTCCGGKLHNTTLGCCGGQALYNKSSQICCEYNGALSVAVKENNFCCYDKAYNERSHYCVNDQILSLNENMCGNEKYNISEKKCCDQTLYDKPRFLPDCCGSQIYDVNNSKCCRGTKTVIPNNLECCGTGSFNESTHLCCNNVIKSKEDGSRCCGTETMNDTEGCCGTKVYSLSTHQCCNETMIPKHLTCCGHHGYDNSTHLCTSNYTVTIRPKIKDCINRSKKYTSKRQKVSHSICNTWLWNFRRIYKEMKEGNQCVCKRHAYNITINNTSRREDGLWILYARRENKGKMESDVRIIVPCPSEKLNKTGNFLLLTDGAMDGDTELMLLDSDLLIHYHPKLQGLVGMKKRTCRLLSVVLSDIRWAVNRFIRTFLSRKGQSFLRRANNGK